jgi:hypothetical protein
MSQRASGYVRRADEDYPTPAWVTAAIAGYLARHALHIWEPAAGKGALAKALTAEGFRVAATTDDFLRHRAPPHSRVDAIVTNPPYGADRRGVLACAFIRHALSLEVRITAMLLRVDFDSAKTRVDLFRDNPTFAGKIVLLDRIKWFDGPSAPSDNHAWFVWDRASTVGRPWTAYAEAARPAKARAAA